MNKKEKIYEILLVGSGLSSICFADSYLEKNEFLDIISPQYKKKKTKKKFSYI